MKILLLCEYYPPDRRVAARRIDALVEMLTQKGAEVVVVLPASAKAETEACRVRKIILLPQESAEIKKSGYALPSFVRGIIAAKRFIKPAIVDSSVKPWVRALGRSNDILPEAETADVIIASYGPAGPLWAGSLLSRRVGVPLVVDIRDSFESRQAHMPRVGQWLVMLTLEKWLLSQASFLVTVGKVLAKHLERRYKKPVVAVYNGWSESDIISAAYSPSSSPFAYFAGTIYPHQMAALSIFMRALAAVEGLRLRIRLLDGCVESIKAVARKAGVSERIEVLEPTDQETVRCEVAESVGVLVLEALEIDYPWRAGTVTGKLLGLMASGKKGMVISHPRLEAARLTRLASGWESVSSVDECEAVLRNMISSGNAVDNREVLKEYHRDRQMIELWAQLCRLEKF